MDDVNGSCGCSGQRVGVAPGMTVAEAAPATSRSVTAYRKSFRLLRRGKGHVTQGVVRSIPRKGVVLV